MTPELQSDALIAFLTQYLGLGLVFFGGLYIAYRQGDIGFKTPRQRRWMGLLVGGYIFYAFLHGFFQFIAPRLWS
ncbi:hypothetical protein KAI87_10175 [Myxococcota bacterium]|nr:hypothetical protein [Myxococcota bacterium]